MLVRDLTGPPHPPQTRSLHPLPTQRDNKTAKQIEAAVKVFNDNRVPVGVVKVRPGQLLLAMGSSRPVPRQRACCRPHKLAFLRAHSSVRLYLLPAWHM